MVVGVKSMSLNETFTKLTGLFIVNLVLRT